MGVQGLPQTFAEWKKMRQEHLNRNLQHSFYTNDLFRQYHKHLGMLRYLILLEAQTLVVPQPVRKLLGFRRISLLNPLLKLYKLSRSLKADWLLKAVILPSMYKNEIKALDTIPA
jgi:hypothetical protein